MKTTNKKGFTLVELLVVLLIIGILAAIAAPLYLAHARRARMSEAVATLSLMRQAQRDYNINHGTFYDVTALATTGNIQKGLPPANQITLATGALGTANVYGVDVDAGVAQYFSNSAFSIDAFGTGAGTAGASGLFTNPPAVGFIVSADGNFSEPCSAAVQANCAINAAQVGGAAGGAAANGAGVFRAEMDNSGRIFVCYSNCGTASNWGAY